MLSLLAAFASFCENIRLNLEVKVGFLDGVGRSGFASPLVRGASCGTADGGKCWEFTEVVDAVGAGEG